MKKHYRWNPLILVKNLVILATVILIAWGTISYCEILVKNTSINTRPIYSSWNLWTSVLAEKSE